MLGGCMMPVFRKGLDFSVFQKGQCAWNPIGIIGGRV
jgi:hypothetical protein